MLLDRPLLAGDADGQGEFRLIEAPVATAGQLLATRVHPSIRRHLWQSAERLIRRWPDRHRQ
ncbi:hypothetical protein [Micromonospora sp. RV43]|uniref:hypothetical protein n=1 Tax=Micromonospora sp. RV43 TaxID=1661387 RepID=UPI00064C39C3|nr:hypothetical protein [Micromonospora sp. RV43]